MKLRMPFYAWLLAAGLLSYLLHEAAHWLAGAAFGFSMEFHLNGVKYLSASLPWQRAVMDAAGPLVTIVQALVAYRLAMRTQAPQAYAFLYFAFFMRLVAGLVSVMHPNDEARIGLFLGIGKWTLPLLVAAGLLLLVWKASRRLGLTWKDQALCYVAASLVISLIVGLDRFVL
jgi:glucan phosphoethanolaminetransferase (alkaline phosphatase superfamily)